MNIRHILAAAVLVMLAACAQKPVADPSKAESYAVVLPLEPATGGPLQRLTLPPQSLVALKRADLGDVRVFDARGRVVPIALIDGNVAGAGRKVDVPIYPVVGPAGAQVSSGLSIRIEDKNVARIVTVGATPTADNSGAPAAVLLDTHTIAEPVSGLALDVTIPAGQPVTLTLLVSPDLKDWEPLAQKTLFRPTDGAPLLGGNLVSLPAVDLRNRYVGINWSGATGVALKRATVLTSSSARPARVAIGTSPVALRDAHELRFDLPGMARLAAIRVTESGPDGVMPARLYGRDQSEAPWTLLAVTTLRPGPAGNVLDLEDPPMASYKLEADRRTAGFSVSPGIELLLDPIELLVALSGTSPYRLAVGQAAAPAAFLSRSEIAPHADVLNPGDLPQARLKASSMAPPVVTLASGADDGALQPRKLALWAALLLGTLVLAFAAIRLLKANAADVTPTGE